MPLVSNYANGKFYEGRWICGCGLDARWTSSKQEHSKGEKFARCPKSPDEQCAFFLTAYDDASARLEKSSDIPPAPQTPTRKNITGLSTPKTDASLSSNSFAATSSRGKYLKRPEDTPTPHRFRHTEDGDLSLLIFDLLQKEGVVLKSSTQSAIRHIIGDRVAGYEAKLENSSESLENAFNRLDELERRDSTAIS